MLSVRDLTQPHVQGGLALGRDVLKALGMGDGMTHMEWFRTASGEAVFGEIACRPGGACVVDMMNYTNDVDLFPGAQVRWGLGYMLNMEPGPNGRSAGTVSWGGIFNTYYWLDPRKRVTGLIMTQILPFADTRALALYGQFERGVYEALKA